MVTASAICLQPSETVAPPAPKLSNLTCSRCRDRKQKCDKKLPHCSRCVKSNVVCSYKWSTKSNSTNSIAKPKPTKFYYNTFQLKTYQSDMFLSLQRSEILTFNNNLKQNMFYLPPKIVGNHSKLSNLFDFIIRGSDLYFVQLQPGVSKKPNVAGSPVSLPSSPSNLVRDVASNRAIWEELMDLYLKECFPYNTFFNLKSFHPTTASPLLLSVVYWAGYQYRKEKYPSLTQYLDSWAASSVRKALMSPSVPHLQALMVAMFVHLYKGEFSKSRALLAHCTRMSVLLGVHEKYPFKVLEQVQERQTVWSQVVIFNSVMRLYCQRPCYVIPAPRGMTCNAPEVHIMSHRLQVPPTDYEIVRGHCIYYLTQYYDDIFVNVLHHLSECTSTRSPLKDQDSHQTQLDVIFHRMTSQFTALIRHYPHEEAQIQPYLNYNTFKYYFYSFRLYDYEISTKTNLTPTTLTNLTQTLRWMSYHYETIPLTLKGIMRNLVQGVGLTMLKVAEMVPEDRSRELLMIVREIKRVCGSDQGLDLLAIGLEQLAL